MKLNKKIVVAAAAGTLALAASVPAMAFENVFNGTYKMKYFVSNYETGGSGWITPANTTTEKARTNNYFEQRARLKYTAKASDDLKLVTYFEIDSVFGDKAQASASRGNGGALESDAVNLETKNVYLDFKIPSTPVNVKAGIQPVKDKIKGVFFDFDAAGIQTTTKVGAATIGLGYYRAYDNSYFSTTTRPRGIDNLDILAADATVALSKDVKLGLAYYLYSDSRNTVYATTGDGTTNLHTMALTADAKLGKLALSAFAAKQLGLTKSNATTGAVAYNGYALNAAAKMPVGPGTIKTAFLFTSGDDGKDGVNTAWQAVNQNQNTATITNPNTTGTFTNSYNESGMMLLNRNLAQAGTSTDQYLIGSTNNKDQGVWLYTLGYDATITPKMYVNTNVGFAWSARENSNKPVDQGCSIRGGSNFMGTEVNVETGYKMYPNLTASFQAAYVMLGGYYTKTAKNHNGVAVDPDNPYTARVVLSYAF